MRTYEAPELEVMSLEVQDEVTAKDGDQYVTSIA